MTLEEYSWAASIANSIVNLLFLAVSTTVAIFAYKWHRQNGKVETARKLSEDLRHYNELVLSNEDLQSFAAENHRWGPLTNQQVIQMYRSFILLNISASLYESNKRGAVDASLYQSQ